MVEFALVLPILLFLVVIVADFGRIFATSLAIEAAARDAAEIVANDYLVDPPGPLNAAAPPGDSAYYGAKHDLAAQTVCDETADLPNSNFNAGTGRCDGMPLIRVCIHDSQDTNCGSEAQSATVPTNCGSMLESIGNGQGGGASRYVEVRVCYRFTPILNLPILSFGDFWLERTRTFVIPCYFVLGETECGS